MQLESMSLDFGKFARSKFTRGRFRRRKISKGYEAVLSGAGDRILGMSEQEQVHRHWWEKWALAGQIALVTVGLISALIVALALINAAVQVILAGYPSAGIAMISVTGVAMVTGFLRTRPLLAHFGGEKKERQERASPSSKSRTKKQPQPQPQQ